MSISNILINDTKAPFKTINCKSLTCDEFITDTFTANTINSQNINNSVLLASTTINSENIVSESITVTTLDVAGKITINSTVPILNGGSFNLEERAGQLTATMSGYVLGAVSVVNWTFTHPSIMPSSLVIISPGTRTMDANAPLQAGQLTFCLRSITDGQFMLTVANPNSIAYTGGVIGFTYLII
jgi:hypothetical protein